MLQLVLLYHPGSLIRVCKPCAAKHCLSWNPIGAIWLVWRPRWLCNVGKQRTSWPTCAHYWSLGWVSIMHFSVHIILHWQRICRIGSACARDLYANGVHLALTYSKNKAAVESLISDLQPTRNGQTYSS